MITYNAYLEGQLSNDITRPQYLIEIKFSITQSIATLKDVVWQRRFWFKTAGVNVGFSSRGPNLPPGLNLEIMNTNIALSTFVLREGISGIPVKCWKIYGGKERMEDEEAILMFDGFFNSMTPSDKRLITLHAEALNFGFDQQFPRILVERPNFNFLPSPGEVFKWGEREITVL